MYCFDFSQIGARNRPRGQHGIRCSSAKPYDACQCRHRDVFAKSLPTTAATVSSHSMCLPGFFGLMPRSMETDHSSYKKIYILFWVLVGFKNAKMRVLQYRSKTTFLIRLYDVIRHHVFSHYFNIYHFDKCSSEFDNIMNAEFCCCPSRVKCTPNLTSPHTYNKTRTVKTK